MSAKRQSMVGAVRYLPTDRGVRKVWVRNIGLPTTKEERERGCPIPGMSGQIIGCWASVSPIRGQKVIEHVRIICNTRDLYGTINGAKAAKGWAEEHGQDVLPYDLVEQKFGETDPFRRS